jgi:hypothetical protein
MRIIRTGISNFLSNNTRLGRLVYPQISEAAHVHPWALCKHSSVSESVVPPGQARGFGRAFLSESPPTPNRWRTTSSSKPSTRAIASSACCGPSTSTRGAPRSSNTAASRRVPALTASWRQASGFRCASAYLCNEMENW